MLIQLTTYGYVYYERARQGKLTNPTSQDPEYDYDPDQDPIQDPTQDPTQVAVPTNQVAVQAFVTIKKGIDVTKLTKQLSKTFKQPIVLTIENEFEIDCLEKEERLSPHNGAIYDSKEMREFMSDRRKPLVFTEELLDVGTIIIHPALGKGEIEGYEANTYDKYDSVRRPAPSFYYVVSFDKDAYLDEAGKEHQPKRNFEPATLHSILRQASAQ